MCTILLAVFRHDVVCRHVYHVSSTISLAMSTWIRSRIVGVALDVKLVFSDSVESDNNRM